MKKILFLIAAVVANLPALAQEAAATSFKDDPFNHPFTPFYILVAFIFIVLVLVIVVSVIMLRAVNMLVEQNAREKAKESGVAYVPRVSWWTRFNDQLNDAVPVEREADIDLGHSYDGIRELDNHLPPWWKWLFYGTIGWSVVYIIVFHFTATLPLSGDEYENEVAQAEMAKQKFLATQPQASVDVDNLKYTADAALIENGKKVFMDNNCGSCHRNDGGGNTIGPNLTDAYWLHGADVKEIFKTVKDGAVEKGMPAWGRSLSATEMRDVTFFIMSLKGTNPPDAKTPQGVLVEQEAPVKSDTLKTQASL